MNQKYPFVKVNLTSEEKQKIDTLARQNNLSTSAFVKNQLASVLNTDVADIICEQPLQKRDIRISVMLSKQELDTIKQKAGHKPLSSYIRTSALNGSKVIKIDVYDDDVTELIHNIQPEIISIYNVISALHIQNRLHDSQYKQLESLLTDILKSIRNTSSLIINNRTSLRNTRLRELRRRCNNAVKTETDSLANFDNDL